MERGTARIPFWPYDSLLVRRSLMYCKGYGNPEGLGLPCGCLLAAAEVSKRRFICRSRTVASAIDRTPLLA